MTSRHRGFSGRRTNLALLVTLAVAFTSGATVQALGTETTSWLRVLHGAVGLVVLVLAPWKAKVAQRGLSRRNRGRTISLVLATLASFTIATGILHTTGVEFRALPVTTLWLHVASALVLVPVLAWHFFARGTYPKARDLERRNLLRLLGLAATGATLWWVADQSMRVAGWPGSRRRFTGSHETSSFEPSGVPVTSWLNDRVPEIDPADWRLALSDRVGTRVLAIEELATMENENVTAALDCTSGWWSRQSWQGVRLDHLLEPGDAPAIVVRSFTGYARRFPVGDLNRLWLASSVGELPLSAGHGFPARLVAPDRRGFWWVKWVVGIETSNVPWWVQPPYPLS